MYFGAKIEFNYRDGVHRPLVSELLKRINQLQRVVGKDGNHIFRWQLKIFRTIFKVEMFFYWFSSDETKL